MVDQDLIDCCGRNLWRASDLDGLAPVPGPSPSVLNSVIIRISAALFAFWIFELLTLYPRIEGLTIGSALLPAFLSFVCGQILWSCSVLLPNKWRWPRVIALTPCIFIFPVVTYLIEPLLLPIPVISLGLAARSICKRERP